MIVLYWFLLNLSTNLDNTPPTVDNLAAIHNISHILQTIPHECLQNTERYIRYTVLS